MKRAQELEDRDREARIAERITEEFRKATNEVEQLRAALEDERTRHHHSQTAILLARNETVGICKAAWDILDAALEGSE